MRLSERVYRFLLRLYPADFRHEYGNEMSILFRERVREDRLSACMQVVRDLLLHAPQEHWNMLRQDVNYALRTWRQAPALPVIALLALALGIGANTAIFSIVHAVLLRPLPVREPDRLVRVCETNPTRNLWAFTASFPNYLSWTEQSRHLELAAFSGQAVTWTGDGEPERLEGMAGTASLLSVLGTSLARGRWFTTEEQYLGRHQVVVLSHGLWVRRFGQQADIVGRKLIFNETPYTVIGVAQPDFRVPAAADVWVPLIVNEPGSHRGNHYITVIGRLHPGFTIEQAQAEMTSIANELGRRFPDTNKEWNARIVPLLDWLVNREIRTALMVLLVAVAAVLLIACANVANLLLVRAAARRKEIAIRSALGAGVTRISRQLLTESLLLSVAGGAIGLWAAHGAAAVARGSLTDLVPRANEISVDWNVLAFALGLSLFTGLLFGMAPLWQLGEKRSYAALKEAGRTSQAAPRSRTRTLLVVAQVSLAALLLIATGLLVQSFLHLGRVALGVDPENVLTARISFPRDRYPTGRNSAEMLSRLTKSLESAPGVKMAGFSSAVPLGPGGQTGMGAAASDGGIPSKNLIESSWRLADSGFFRTLQIPVLRGRTFSQEDSADSRRVFVISREAARIFYGDRDPIGRSLRLENGFVGEVIGVVGDVRMMNIGEPPSPTVYLMPAQFGRMAVLRILVRTQGDPESAIPILREKLKQIDPNLVAHGFRSMSQLVEDNSATARIGSGIMVLLAGVALCLGVIGIYGVISYLVALRRQEYGVRMALGARPVDLLTLVLGQGLRLVVPGIALGIVAALFLDRLLETLLFGISPRDPRTFLAVAVILAAAALVACYAPARRAAKVDPITALRSE
jgi:putative ABC transport system permease protein